MSYYKYTIDMYMAYLIYYYQSHFYINISKKKKAIVYIVVNWQCQL